MLPVRADEHGPWQVWYPITRKISRKNSIFAKYYIPILVSRANIKTNKKKEKKTKKKKKKDSLCTFIQYLIKICLIKIPNGFWYVAK